MQFNPAAFNAHLNNIGQEFLWRQSFACACINPSSGSPKANCVHCAGKGRTWLASVPAIAGIASQKTQREWAQSGLWESGDAVVSIPEDSPLYAVGHMDRVTMLNSTDPFSMALVHGAPNERILVPVQEITRVFWYATDNAVVEGGIPAVAANGVLTWASGVGEPPPAKAYSISGTRYAEFYCFQQYSSDRNQHSGMRLPKRVVLRKYDLFGARSGGATAGNG